MFEGCWVKPRNCLNRLLRHIEHRHAANAGVVQPTVRRFCQLFGDWMEQHHFGKYYYVGWKLDETAGAKGRCIIAVERDETPRVPPEAAMMEYILVMATGDAESRPKGGRPVPRGEPDS